MAPDSRGFIGSALLIALALLALAAAAVEAQAPQALSPGTRSLSFGIDGSGTSEAGIWYFLSQRSSVGLLGSLDWMSEDRGADDDRSHLEMTLGPRVKWYLTNPARVAPFWHGGFSFGHVRSSREGREDRTGRTLGVEGGFGVDWFPVEQMSVGGWTGLRLRDERLPSGDTRTRLTTLTTGLRVHLYF